jgi:hypothetical protein
LLESQVDEKIHLLLVGGFNLPLRKMMDFVSWDYDMPNCFWKVIKLMFQTTNQFNISTNFGWLEANSLIKILPSFHVNVF